MIGKFKSSRQGFQQQKIIVWTGLVSEIPAGWFICDGNNGTPDLVNKMLRGHGSANTSAGTTGGTNQNSINTSQIPSHAHSATLDSTQVGDHNHHIIEGTEDWNGAETIDRTSESFEYSSDDYWTSTNGNHSHTYSVGATGSGSGIENRPAHRNVIYIMRK